MFSEGSISTFLHRSLARKLTNDALYLCVFYKVVDQLSNHHFVTLPSHLIMELSSRVDELKRGNFLKANAFASFS